MTCVSDFRRFIFVVGAPRSGTTTLAGFLGRHPSVQFPLVKEPHFFAQYDLRDLDDGALRRTVEDEYLARFFPEIEPGKTIGGDGSVSYLYAPEQLEPIIRLWPDARFIVAARDPMAMVPSLHERLVYTGDENITDFERAWNAIPDRRAGKRIPRSCAEPRWLRYDEAGRFATYLDRLQAAVGAERCRVVLFDDLKAKPEETLTALLDWLDLPRVPIPPVKAARKGRRVRWHWLQRLLKRPPHRVRGYLAGKHMQARVRDLDQPDARYDGGTVDKVMSIRKRLLRWNRIDGGPRSVPLALQQQIRDTFRDEVDRFGAMIGRDLSHWLQPRDGKSKLESP